jgi:hypothetical protein
MTETIDRDRAVELLRQQVEKVGADHVYGSRVCVYFNDDGCPSCIVGHVLADLGVQLGQVHELASGADMGNGIAINAVRVEGVEMTEGARTVFAVAQRLQDNGETWGDALEGAVLRAAGLFAVGVR